MTRQISLVLLGGLAVLPLAAHAMGYDSLACPELADGASAISLPTALRSGQDRCEKLHADHAGRGDTASRAERTQVQMIIRTEGRKDCPAK